MKKRNIEEEVQILDTLVRENDQIPSKVRNNILKQVEVVRKCTRPRRSNKGRNQNLNSGLLIPVIVSEEMAKFANWDKDELHSRIDITKIICSYIAKNNLQKPTNRKTILPDQALKDLLRWDAESEKIPVSAMSSDSSDSSHVFSIVKIPSSGLEKPSYYNNSELLNEGGESIALIKTFECLDNGNYKFVLDKDVVINTDEKYVIHIPLTYPKIQTKIGIHLTKTNKEPKTKEPKSKEPKSKEPKTKDSKTNKEKKEKNSKAK